MTSLRRPVVAVLVGGAVACVGAPPPEGSTPVPGGGARPNVLVIVTDDQRDGTLRVMPKTVRWLARGGIRFTNAFVTTPLCCPSRATIFSGRFAHNHGVHTNQDPEDLAHDATIQRYLRDAGYLTAIAGKFLNNWDLTTAPPYFDRWTIFENGYTGRRFNVDGRVGVIGRYSTDFLADRAVGYVRSFEEAEDRPWLLYVTPTAPHGPYTPPPRYEDAPVPPWRRSPAIRAAVRADLPPFYSRRRPLSLARMEQVRADQLRTLMAVDDLVDRVMSELDRLGELRQTLVFFLSDNGFLWGDHGLVTKRMPYSPSIEVPLLVRWPGAVRGGRVDRRPVTNADIAPTILEAAGISPPRSPPMDGRSLWEPARRARLLFEYFPDPVSPPTPAWASVRTARLQYVEYYGSTGRILATEFYDLDEDPWQLHNLLGDRDRGNDPEQIDELSAWLAQARRCVGASGPRGCP